MTKNRSTNYVEVPIEIKEIISIDFETKEKWQNLINILVSTDNSISALIMRLTKKGMEVFLLSKNYNNNNKIAQLNNFLEGYNLESLINDDELLKSDNNLQDLIWGNNHNNLSLNKQFSLPLEWPNGNLFGSIVILSNQKEILTNQDKILLYQFKEMICSDLQNIFYLEKYRKEIDSLKIYNKRNLSYLNQIINDLKSPLKTIFSLSSLALKSKISRKETYEIIRKNSLISSQILDKIMDQTRIQQNSMDLEEEIIDLQCLVNKIQENNTFIPSKISFNLSNCSFQYIYSKKNDVRTIFNKLVEIVNNSDDKIKKLEVSLNNYADNYGIINNFTFRYGGKLFDDELLETLFDPYFNRGSLEDRNQLSLILVKKLCQSIGASINCYTNTDTTVFVIEFTTSLINENKISNYKEAFKIDNFSFKGEKVIVITDTPSKFDFLNHYKLNLFKFSTTIEAYSQLILHKIDLIIIDENISYSDTIKLYNEAKGLTNYKLKNIIFVKIDKEVNLVSDGFEIKHLYQINEHFLLDFISDLFK